MKILILTTFFIVVIFVVFLINRFPSWLYSKTGYRARPWLKAIILEENREYNKKIRQIMKNSDTVTIRPSSLEVTFANKYNKLSFGNQHYEYCMSYNSFYFGNITRFSLEKGVYKGDRKSLNDMKLDIFNIINFRKIIKEVEETSAKERKVSKINKIRNF